MKQARDFSSWLLLHCSLLAAVWTCPAADDYQLGPDSQPKEGVPHGTVTKHKWASKIFPGTERDYWIYVPAQYDATKPGQLLIKMCYCWLCIINMTNIMLGGIFTNALIYEFKHFCLKHRRVNAFPDNIVLMKYMTEKMPVVEFPQTHRVNSLR